MVKIKKTVSSAVKQLVNGGSLGGELRLTAVAAALASVEESSALGILKELGKEAGRVGDPILWIKEKAWEAFDPDFEPPADDWRNNGRPGDWTCPECGNSVFARHRFCGRCKTHRPGGDKGGKGGSKGFKRSDWACPSCQDVNFGRNDECRKCGEKRPEDGSADVSSTSGFHKPGDWDCPNCGDHQYARNTECRKCQTPKPENGEERPA